MLVRRTLLRSLLVSLLFFLSATCMEGAAEAPAAGLAREGLYRLLMTPADTSSPRATLGSFLDNMNLAYAYVHEAHEVEKTTETILVHAPEVKHLIALAEAHFQQASQCLDLSGIPRLFRMDKAYESALLLKEILDRVELPPDEEIPGAAYAHGPEKNAPWRIPGTSLRLSRMEDGPHEGKYLFSAETESHLATYYQKVKQLPYRQGATPGFYDFYSRNPGTLYPPRWAELLPTWMMADLADQALWQWGALLLLFVGIFLLFLGAVRGTGKELDRVFPAFRPVMHFIPPVTAVVVSFAASHVVDDVINITGIPLLVVLGGFNVIRWFGLAWATFLTGDLVAEILISSPSIERGGVDASLVQTLTRLVSLGLALAVLVRGAESMGVSLIPIVTGFGVVGLAFSLAAKPTVENIIGGITLFADRTVRVGEYCRFNDTIGKVLHIGLRSTRILDRDRSIVSVPNADFSQLHLVNLSRRKMIPFETKLQLQYETTPEQLRFVLSRVKDMLELHPDVDASNHRVKVHLAQLGEFSLDVHVKAYTLTGDWDRFQEIREELLFSILNILDDLKVSLAFPTRTHHIVNS